MKQSPEIFPRQSKVEFEKYGTEVILEFLGGVGDKEKGVSLTGSATKLTIIKPDGEKVVGLIDFGMFQGCEKELEYNEILPFDLSEIKFSIATHTHLDHIGKLLHLSKEEFDGVIWTTKVNKEIIPIMLEDVIRLQPENPISQIEKIESEIKNSEIVKNQISNRFGDNDSIQQIEEMIDDKKLLLKKLKANVENLEKKYFDTKDLVRVIEKTNSIGFYEKVEVSNDIQLSFIPAGHLPGSAQAILKIKTGKNKYITIGFSGDIGKFKNPSIFGKPQITKEKLDIFMIESTYAGRYHLDFQEEEDEIVDVISQAIEKKGKIIIPAFMQGRAQELSIYLLNLMELGKIPTIPIFYHSKSIEKINDIYRRHFPKTFRNLKNIRKAVNGTGKTKETTFENYKKSAILIASGGMSEGGTINNYFAYFQMPKNLFISSGYQAEGTRGNQIFAERTKEIEIPGIGKIQINCDIHNFRGFSGHGDQEDLLTLIRGMSFSKDAKIIINHGEKTPEQITFGYAIKGVIGRTKEVLFADFNEVPYGK